MFTDNKKGKTSLLQFTQKIYIFTGVILTCVVLGEGGLQFYPLHNLLKIAIFICIVKRI